MGHALAFAMAVEAAAGIDVHDRGRLLRALLLELERLYNHVADLGALANDVGFGIAQAHALRLREGLLQLNAATTGHRLVRGGISIGGARVLALPDVAALRTTAGGGAAGRHHPRACDGPRPLHRYRRTHPRPGCNDGYARLRSPRQRRDADVRCDRPFVDLGAPFTVVVEDGGDVLARYLGPASSPSVRP
jgi:Ni,Fe-hydrogenase III large subunit